MKPRLSLLELAGALLAGGCAYATQFVEAHIWSPAYTYYLLLLLVAVDGVVQARVQRKRFRPLHLALQLLAYTFILGFAHGFAKHEVGLVWLAQMALAPFVVFHLRRLIISFGKLGLVDRDVATLLELKIGRRAVADEAKPGEAPALVEPVAVAPSEAVPA
ncbi:hypothetical protein GCM10027048_20480 [Hymenobacter coalescens]